MMKPISILSFSLILLSLSACVIIPIPRSSHQASSYPVLGVFDDHNEVFRGRIYEKAGVPGQSVIELQGQVTGMKCYGSSYATNIPSHMVNCKGLEGDAKVSCDDGRIIAGKWKAIVCRKGIGEGVDQIGNRLTFVYGMSDIEAQRYIERLMQLTSRQPPVPPVYRPKQTRKKKGFSTGTGFFVSEDGYLLTSYHVIEDASEMVVMTSDEDLLKAKLVTTDPANDLALLKVNHHSRPLKVGANTYPNKGDDVFTVGYPLIAIQGQEQKANFGRINALSGTGGDIRLLQIDVPIQPGNSGGPLLNKRGEVIGIVTATLDQLQILQQSGSIPQNVGYAVKADYAVGLLRGTLGNKWIRGEQFEAKRGLSGLIRLLEPSVVLVIAK
jgi:S1-C subfamily serine protease